ncbi:hypothetical protein ANABIO32_14590 [Rossellomorea marisflavi]|nr:hypothetical protein ANABIO32_14590 [Rossellomorea marisflavi]
MVYIKIIPNGDSQRSGRGIVVDINDHHRSFPAHKKIRPDVAGTDGVPITLESLFCSFRKPVK